MQGWPRSAAHSGRAAGGAVYWRAWTRPRNVAGIALCPAWLVFGSLAVTGLLFLSERWRWFPFNEHKGWTVLVAVAGVGVVLLAMLLWWLVALVFRWRFQFGIRTLLVLTVAVALPCSWVATEIREAKRHDEAVYLITKLGGSVLFDYQLDASNNLINGARPPATAWLRSCMGDGFFMCAGKVSIDGPLTDESWKPLESLTELRSLWLDSTDTTDEDLAHLKGSINLRSLSLLGQHGTSKISGEGLHHVKNLPQLEELCLCNAPITDAGLTQLGNLTQLKVVHLSNWASRWPSDQPPRVTDAGLRHLGKLTKLESLNLTGDGINGTLMTDTSLEHLKELTALRSLVLTWTDVTHSGLRHLTGLTELRELQLNGNHVIGPGLEHLKELKHLSHLTLFEDDFNVRDDKRTGTFGRSHADRVVAE